MGNKIISFDHIISLQNLHEAWREFVCGKKYKPDVAEFTLKLCENIYSLHNDLKNRTYTHGHYEAFSINDPKPRNIHKASVRDRLLHHAIYRVLYPHFDKKFIYDSYSCRYAKGTHRALDRFNRFVGQASQSNSRTCWVLKCDVRKFFASIDQMTLMAIVRRHIADANILWLIGRVVGSFHSTAHGRGLPLGNLTSQILVNVYMNEFDQFVKHGLKQKYYIRYADDFVIMHHDKDVLAELLPKIGYFLDERLKLSLHPDKIFLKTASSGVDFLGWVHFPQYRILRTTTKRRMFVKLAAYPLNGSKNSEENFEKRSQIVQSYVGLLSHGNAYKLGKKVMVI